MKKRVFNPDFTSLLDVIMIILFFFILFSKLDIAEAEKEAKETMDKASSMMDEADSKLDEANKKDEHAQDLLDQVENSDARSAANIEGLADFKAGVYLRFKLEMDKNPDQWKLVILCNDEMLESIEQAEQNVISEKIINAISKKGYTKDDTIIGLFEYSGTAGGSYAATKRITEAFDVVNKEYKYLYISDFELP